MIILKFEIRSIRENIQILSSIFLYSIDPSHHKGSSITRPKTRITRVALKIKADTSREDYNRYFNIQWTYFFCGKFIYSIYFLLLSHPVLFWWIDDRRRDQLLWRSIHSKQLRFKFNQTCQLNNSPHYTFPSSWIVANKYVLRIVLSSTWNLP